MESTGDFLIGTIAAPTSFFLKMFHNAFSRPTKSEREAWARHAKTDRLSSFSEAEQTYSNYIENAVVRRHLFFRYSVIWEK